MPNPVGQGVLTINGANAVADAATTRRTIKPKYYKASRNDIPLDTTLTDISGVWRQADISGYVKLDERTVQFWIDIPPEQANDWTRTVGLYLDDGTLFAIAKPPYPLPPASRQSIFIQLQLEIYTLDQVFNFQYIPFYEAEQSYAILDLSAVLGKKIAEHKQEIERLKEAREVLFANSREFRKRIEKLEKDAKTLWNNQLAIFASLALHARLLVEHKQEIERLKGGV